MLTCPSPTDPAASDLWTFHSFEIDGAILQHMGVMEWH